MVSISETAESVPQKEYTHSYMNEKQQKFCQNLQHSVRIVLVV